jgi:hypothetical protein
VERVSGAEALDPTQKTLEVGKTLADQGFSVTLKKIEFGEKDTRVYVSAYNRTNSDASFYDFDAKILQGTHQLDADTPFDYSVKEVQEDLSPGVRTNGVMVFGKANPSQPLQVHFEWSSNNYNINTPHSLPGVPLNFRELRHGEVQHSHTPIGRGQPARDARNIVGYYVSYVQN